MKRLAAKTKLVATLLAIRQKYIQHGGKLFSLLEIRKELRNG